MHDIALRFWRFGGCMMTALEAAESVDRDCDTKCGERQVL